MFPRFRGDEAARVIALASCTLTRRMIIVVVGDRVAGVAFAHASPGEAWKTADGSGAIAGWSSVPSHG
ncbi:hypothetical protein BC443_16255 [Salinicola sp. MIT1003]|nr:hypothetical protein BC443_16255 [Salinicola sp. MIT1003]